MKKKFIFVLLLVFILVGCKKQEANEYIVSFLDQNDEFLGNVFVKEGCDVVIPNYSEEKGYYYAITFDESELKNIQENKVLTLKKTQYLKDVKYVVNDEVVFEYKDLKFKEKEREPQNIGINLNNYEWSVEEKFENEKFLYIYTLVKKTSFNIEFYDGEDKLDLGVDSYKAGEKTTLPKYSKEGYEFLGWFVSDISLGKIEEISEESEGDYKLYARFLETVIHKELVLPEASNHFTGISRIYNPSYDFYTYNPILPDDAKSTNLMNYDWSSSDTNICNISIYSSISVVSSGFAVITGTLKSDPTYIINCVIKTSTNGVEFSSVEEANKIDLVNVTFVGMNDEVIEVQKVKRGGYAYLPTPKEYEGYAFVGWDKDNWNITEDCEFKAIYDKTKTNPYVGKTFSFLGDSLTSFAGYIPTGFQSFFPAASAKGDTSNNVNDVNQMWFMQLLSAVGGKLFVNNSYGGTCCYGGSEPTNSDSRLSHLVVNNQYADYTVVYMGNNDCAGNVNYPESYNATTFENAYRTQLEKIKALCPNTKIIVCTMAQSKLFVQETRDQYNEIIRSLANEFDCQIIELEDVDLREPINDVPLIVDSGHPSMLGMQLLTKQIISEMLK